MLYEIKELSGLTNAPSTPNAVAINDNGDAVGWVVSPTPAPNGTVSGVIWYAGGQKLILPVPGGLNDINREGTAVGWSGQPATPSTHAIMVKKGQQPVDLGEYEFGAACINSPSSGNPWQRAANLNALVYAVIFGGVVVDGGGPTSLGPVDPWGPPSILSWAAQDAMAGIEVDAFARQLADRVGGAAISRAALEMTARAVDRLMATPAISPVSQSASRPRGSGGPALRRGRFPVPPRPRSQKG